MIENFRFGNKPSGRPFVKMHGLLNHFVITDGRNEPYRPDVAEIVRICDVETGVGGDQLIIIENPTGSEGANAAVAFMRILNVDGREVEACGNATRCIAWLLMEETGSDQVVLQTLAGLIDCRKTGAMEVSCTMGRVRTEWQEIPLVREADTSHVDLDSVSLTNGMVLNIGNPHIVFFVDDIDAVDICGVAPAIQKHELFPQEVNVGIAQMLSDDHLRSVVYERGAGLTTACGSGACVAAYAARVRGLTEEKELTVSMPAGDVRIAISDEGVATMTGPVAYCYSGFF
jgi:diaminopimelate epimerase